MAKEEPRSTSKSYTVTNPNRGRRVIFDRNQKAITIDGGATLQNLQLSEEIVHELQERERVNPGQDLRVTTV